MKGKAIVFAITLVMGAHNATAFEDRNALIDAAEMTKNAVWKSVNTGRSVLGSFGSSKFKVSGKVSKKIQPVQDAWRQVLSKQDYEAAYKMEKMASHYTDRKGLFNVDALTAVAMIYLQEGQIEDFKRVAGKVVNLVEKNNIHPSTEAQIVMSIYEVLGGQIKTAYINKNIKSVIVKLTKKGEIS